jgi:hypothetical protein
MCYYALKRVYPVWKLDLTEKLCASERLVWLQALAEGEFLGEEPSGVVIGLVCTRKTFLPQINALPISAHFHLVFISK